MFQVNFGAIPEKMATIQSFEDLDIWQLAREQCQGFQQLCEETLLCKDYGLKDQMNKSSGSAMDCIVEGFERGGNVEFKNFLVISRGSNAEYRSQLYRCPDRKYISKEAFEAMATRNKVIAKKTMSFIQYLQSSNWKGHTRIDPKK